MALAAIYLVQSVHVPASLLGPVAIGGLLVFLAPLSIWLAFSRRIANAGGLYSFVEEAGSGGLALVHGLLWSLSYLLYLAFTVTYIVYYLLPELIPVSQVDQRVLEIALPVLLSVAVIFADRASVLVLAAFGAAQLLLVGVLGVLLLGRPMAAAPAPATVGALPLLAGFGGASLLFVCSSLLLYLGGEARGGTKSIRTSLIVSYLLVAAASLFAAFALAPRLGPQAANSAIPGYAIALDLGGPEIALVVGLVTLASLAGLIVAEFIALARLWTVMFRLGTRSAAVIIGAFFVLADAVSLKAPFRFYDSTIIPSLAALFLAQLIVFLTFPRFLRRTSRARLPAIIAVVVASLWALYGVYLAVSPAPAY